MTWYRGKFKTFSCRYSCSRPWGVCLCAWRCRGIANKLLEASSHALANVLRCNATAEKCCRTALYVSTCNVLESRCIAPQIRHRKIGKATCNHRNWISKVLWQTKFCCRHLQKTKQSGMLQPWSYEYACYLNWAYHNISYALLCVSSR